MLLSHHSLNSIGPSKVTFENGDSLIRSMTPQIPSLDATTLTPPSDNMSTNLSFGVKCGHFGTCRSNIWMSPTTTKVNCQAVNLSNLTNISEIWPPTYRLSEAPENVGGPLSDLSLNLFGELVRD